ncbi:hypothetical protein ABID08_000718 [Rhizobium binae]|uniref:AP2/ERF domain-containing protein n=1 Tax=Rhizobium binae TaxID=1138190 RepID=A0ABV2MB65_9HYPH|nr:NUMOD3 domain-containing DNA-binding protein [Rhizobium binae]MBX4992287.1 hypothetical protein [Rhizobium binae]NKL52426.1 hypothetical protein [Rhizobium leguminosarum bv. viciae]QSY80745.1 hypothetical protein J2J99_13575 [Rhizobium binae]
MEYYTYVWRDAAGVPFYVGKGKGKRAHNTTRRSVDFKEIYAKGGCSVEILDLFIHESQAHAHEVELIELYGRRPFGGTLVNMTDGGEGTSGRKLNDEARAKISAAAKARGIPSETRARLIEATRGKKHTEEHKSKISAALTGRHRPSETRDRISLSRRMMGPKDGFKGVVFSTEANKWMARIRVDGETKYLRCHSVPEDAARAYDKAAFEAWGFDCYLNFPEDFETRKSA